MNKEKDPPPKFSKEKKSTATEAKPSRRLQDSITSKSPTHRLNLDRRIRNSERRSCNNSTFNGPARRYTIDRRKNNRDRREDIKFL